MPETLSTPSPAAPPSAPAPTTSPALVRDPWLDARPYAYDGWMERNGFTPALSALLVGVVAIIAFQIISGIVGMVGVGVAIGKSGEPFDPAALDPAALFARYPGLLLFGNTVGQALGLGLVAWLAARWTSRTGTAAFLRLRAPDGRGLGLAVLGWLVGLPALLWLSEMNALLPMPEWVVTLEAMSTDFLESVLTSGSVGVVGLFLALAITPALFEELLFRGYLQRQVERRWGVLTSVVLVGVVFGLYHLRLSQFVPLAALGVYLGWAVWATGSLWTGSLIHVLHNGTAVFALDALRRSGQIDTLDEVSVPVWAALASAALVVPVVVALRRRRARATTGGPDDGSAVAVSAPPSSGVIATSS